MATTVTPRVRSRVRTMPSGDVRRLGWCACTRRPPAGGRPRRPSSPALITSGRPGTGGLFRAFSGVAPLRKEGIMSKLSGITPSGHVHLGNHLGAVRRWAREGGPDDLYFVA